VLRDVNGYYGVINTEGESIIPFEYSNMGTFNKGVTYIGDPLYWGVINSKGQEVIPMRFYWIEFDYDNELIYCYGDFMHRYYDFKGREINFTKYYKEKGYTDDELIPFNDNSEEKYYQSNNRNIGFKDLSGDLVIECQYDRVFLDRLIDKILVQKGYIYLVIDDKGETLETFSFGAVVSTGYDGLYTMSKNNKWGLINGYGDIIVEPIYYEPILLNENGIGIVSLNVFSKGVFYGVVNKDGDVLLNPEYTIYNPTNKISKLIESDNPYVFYKNGKSFVYSDEGNLIRELNSNIISINDKYFVASEIDGDDTTYTLNDYITDDAVYAIDNEAITLENHDRGFYIIRDFKNQLAKIINSESTVIYETTSSDQLISYVEYNETESFYFKVFDYSTNKYILYDQDGTIIHEDDGDAEVYIFNYDIIVFESESSLTIINLDKEVIFDQDGYDFVFYY
jgi:hypothetical protein